MQCYTQQQIAEAVSPPQKTVDGVLKTFSENGNIAKLAKTDQSAADHATDFTPPIYIVWNFPKSTRAFTNIFQWIPVGTIVTACEFHKNSLW